MTRAAAMTYEDLVQECKRLRAASERAEAEFLAFLVEVEHEHEDTWKQAGCATFEQFITSNGPLCESGRYRMFAMGLANVGRAAALANGAHWTIARGQMVAAGASKKALGEFSERANAFRKVHEVAPSEQAVREWRSQLMPGRDEHATIRRANELDRLRAENAELRAENAALKKRNAELEGLARKTGAKKGTQPQA